MNLNGWVQFRRGILDHLRDGRLSINEFLVLVVLIMLADKRTGRGTINAPALRFFVPGLEKDAAKRVLNSLEEKRYIYRKITPFSKKVYPYWVNRYAPSVGQHKGLQMDLAKVFESKNINDITYINRAPDDAPEGAPDGAPDRAHNYKTREEKQEKRNKTSSSSESASVCASSDEAKPSGAQTIAQRTVKVESALPGALPSKAQTGATPATSQTQTTGQPDFSRMSAEDYFKHIGRHVWGDWRGITANEFLLMSAKDYFKHIGKKQPRGDWDGITANQFLTFKPEIIPHGLFVEAQMKWLPEHDAYVELADGLDIPIPDAIRRIGSIRPTQPQTPA